MDFPNFPNPPTTRDDVAAYCLFYGDVIYVRTKIDGRWTSARLIDVESDEEIARLIDQWWEGRGYPVRILEYY